MPVNIEEIKKLSDTEKLQLIDEIWESIEDHWDKNEPESDEVIHLLNEREALYEAGKIKSASMQEVMKRLYQNLDNANKKD
jgi:putative addiction module component (TIGR02574 family)